MTCARTRTTGNATPSPLASDRQMHMVLVRGPAHVAAGLPAATSRPDLPPPDDHGDVEPVSVQQRPLDDSVTECPVGRHRVDSPRPGPRPSWRIQVVTRCPRLMGPVTPSPQAGEARERRGKLTPHHLRHRRQPLLHALGRHERLHTCGVQRDGIDTGAPVNKLDKRQPHSTLPLRTNWACAWRAASATSCTAAICSGDRSSPNAVAQIRTARSRARRAED